MTMPTVVKIAMPEHNAKAIEMVFSTWLRARYCWEIRWRAYAKPNNATEITTANLAINPTV